MRCWMTTILPIWYLADPVSGKGREARMFPAERSLRSSDHGPYKLFAVPHNDHERRPGHLRSPACTEACGVSMRIEDPASKGGLRGPQGGKEQSATEAGRTQRSHCLFPAASDASRAQHPDPDTTSVQFAHAGQVRSLFVRQPPLAASHAPRENARQREAAGTGARLSFL